MAQKTKTREITIVDKKGALDIILERFTQSKKDYNFEGLSALRKLLTNEKARLLNTVKTKNPISIYQLAKMLGRDFKSVSNDIKLLERFGFIDMVSEKTGKRERLKPVVTVNSIHIELKV
jgi:predicted transcriptional regulator